VKLFPVASFIVFISVESKLTASRAIWEKLHGCYLREFGASALSNSEMAS